MPFSKTETFAPFVCGFTSVDWFSAATTKANRKPFSGVQTIPQTPSTGGKNHPVRSCNVTDVLTQRRGRRRVVLCNHRGIHCVTGRQTWWHFRVKCRPGSNRARHCVSRNTDVTAPTISFSHPPTQPASLLVVPRLSFNLIIPASNILSWEYCLSHFQIFARQRC